MARPKAGTPAGKKATERFRRTMAEKYGDITAHFKEIGRKGGENGRGPNYTGGFAGNIDNAKRAGALGGMRSRRGLKFIKEENGFYVYEDELGGVVRYEKPNNK